MILAELTGGIGNQMFQYAAAKSLSLHHNEELKLVTSEGGKNMPEGLEKRKFDLHHFNITDPIASAEEIEQFNSISTLQRIAEKVKPNHKRKIYKEPFYHYDENFYKASTNVFLKGLWQSEKYFQIHRSEIRQAFRFKAQVVNAFKELSMQMKEHQSASLHIRRGDYLAKISLEVLGLMPMEYYSKGIEYISSKRTNIVFYIFSDDINWAKENLKIDNAVFVSGNVAKTHIEDLYLMSQCKHHIIANSSFSWWGAWLNDDPDKIVIAPNQWFNKGPQDTQDLIPGTWIKI